MSEESNDDSRRQAIEKIKRRLRDRTSGFDSFSGDKHTPDWRELLPEEMPKDEWRSIVVDQQAEVNRTKGKRDYSQLFNDAAIYTPALSEAYVKFVQNKDFAPDQFPFAAKDLNFLDPDSGLFFYPWALYSAGQAASTPGKAKQTSWVTNANRSPFTKVIGDSGGFQIQGNKIPFNGSTTCEQMLRWMEVTSDYSMTLDFPTGGIGAGTVGQHADRLESNGINVTGEARKHGFSRDYMACLLQSEANNVYFAQNRQPGATALLNVMQGRNERESHFWYERMKSFPFEGIAFAGKHSVQFSMTLRRIVQMLNDGLLKNCPWIHFLGVSTLRTAAILTTLQRALRAHPEANKNIQITFDSISGIKAVANGYNAHAGFSFDPKSWRFTQIELSIPKYAKDKRFLNQIISDEIGEKSKNGMIYVPGFSVIGWQMRPCDMLKQGTNKKTGKQQLYMPSSSANCLMNHNMEVLIRGFHQLSNIIDKDGLGAPLPVATIMQLIRSILDPDSKDDPMEIIDLAAPVLDALTMRGNR